MSNELLGQVILAVLGAVLTVLFPTQQIFRRNAPDKVRDRFLNGYAREMRNDPKRGTDESHAVRFDERVNALRDQMGQDHTTRLQTLEAWRNLREQEELENRAWRARKDQQLTEMESQVHDIFNLLDQFIKQQNAKGATT